LHDVVHDVDRERTQSFLQTPKSAPAMEGRHSTPKRVVPGCFRINVEPSSGDDADDDDDDDDHYDEEFAVEV